MRFVLGEYADFANTGIHAVRQREVDNAEFSAEVDRWFGAAIGQFI